MGAPSRQAGSGAVSGRGVKRHLCHPHQALGSLLFETRTLLLQQAGKSRQAALVPNAAVLQQTPPPHRTRYTDPRSGHGNSGYGGSARRPSGGG